MKERYAAVWQNSKFSGLRAPATICIWTKRSAQALWANVCLAEVEQSDVYVDIIAFRLTQA